MSDRSAATARFQRLFPELGTAGVDEVVRDVNPTPEPSGDRPHVMVNMVSTVDGRATQEGRAGAIGNQADRELFHHLRTRVDAVLVGAGTARIEHYGRLVRDPALRAQRERNGLSADPLACLVSGRLNLPAAELPLLRDTASTVAIVTAAGGEVAGAAARIHYLRSASGTVDLAEALQSLRSRFGVNSILCEGGPTLNAALLAQGLVDELFLSFAPKLTGGPAPLTIVQGAGLPRPVELKLRWLLESDGHLFLRYAARR